VFTRDPNRAGTLKHRNSNKPLPQVSQFAEQGVLSYANEQRFDNILTSSLPFEHQTEVWVGQQISIDIHHIANDCLSNTLIRAPLNRKRINPWRDIPFTPTNTPQSNLAWLWKSGTLHTAVYSCPVFDFFDLQNWQNAVIVNGATASVSSTFKQRKKRLFCSGVKVR
jgi:hypothetical protein